MDLNFSKQIHSLYLSPRAYGDIEYKQRKNWNSRDREKREKAHLMLDRLHQELFELCNTTDFLDFEKSSSGEYRYTVTDGFVTIHFILYKNEGEKAIYVTNFVWSYKKDVDGWWYIVDHLEPLDNQILIRKIFEYDFD